jgi:hypothetical protein
MKRIIRLITTGVIILSLLPGCNGNGEEDLPGEDLPGEDLSVVELDDDSSLASKLAWLQNNVKSDTDYIITVSASENINPTLLSFSDSGKINIGITITEKTSGKVPSWAQGTWYTGTGESDIKVAEITASQYISFQFSGVDGNYNPIVSEVFRFDCTGVTGDTVIFSEGYEVKNSAFPIKF